jgi:hypothetical protein
MSGPESEIAMDTLIQGIFVIFNLCEGLLWSGIGIGFAVALSRKRQNPDLMLATALLFLAFGISDFVEITTGGWYKPWWLMLWKASCLVGFAVMYTLFRIRRGRIA